MPPPAKRRRGLAGSIVSTALSAALIGTAVGLTVYRLWRDRGKEPERLPPPPPYDQGEWTPEVPTPPLQILPAPSSSPNRPRKPRHALSSVSKRTTNRRPRARVLHQLPPHSTPAFPAPQPEFNFGRQDEPESSGVEDQMDWIGDKLTMLIEEGKKALNREIVVMSDAQEDEIDDGSGAWEEDSSNQPAPTSISRSSSAKRTRRPIISNNTFDPPFASSAPTPSSMTMPMPISTSPRHSHSHSHSHSRGISGPEHGETSFSISFPEDEQTWESPELRELMERARTRAKMSTARGR